MLNQIRIGLENDPTVKEGKKIIYPGTDTRDNFLEIIPNSTTPSWNVSAAVDERELAQNLKYM